MTFISLVVVLLVLGFFVLLTLRLFPLYMDQFQVRTSMESLNTQPEIGSDSPQEIQKLLIGRLAINDVDDVVGPKNIVIERSNAGTSLTVKYEARKTIFGNVDVVVTFDKTVNLKR